MTISSVRMAQVFEVCLQGPIAGASTPLHPSIGESRFASYRYPASKRSFAGISTSSMLRRASARRELLAKRP